MCGRELLTSFCTRWRYAGFMSGRKASRRGNGPPPQLFEARASELFPAIRCYATALITVAILSRIWAKSPSVAMSGGDTQIVSMVTRT